MSLRDASQSVDAGDAGGASVAVERWGEVRYREAWDRQVELGQRVADGTAANTLVVVTHPPTITLGRNAPESDILFDAEALTERGIEVVRSDRGGRATYHGPGQLVLYPIVDIAGLGLGARAWVELLEDALLATVAEVGVTGGSISGRPGIWAAGAKVASVGLRILNGVSHHGVSLNVDLDVSAFDYIVPCGAAGERITSLAISSGHAPTVDETADLLVGHITRRIRALSEQHAR